jgi:hypothetical protein
MFSSDEHRIDARVAGSSVWRQRVRADIGSGSVRIQIVDDTATPPDFDAGWNLLRKRQSLIGQRVRRNGQPFTRVDD